MNNYEKQYKESQDTIRKYADEVRELRLRLYKAENLLKEIRTKGSHYQIIHEINKFFKEEGVII